MGYRFVNCIYYSYRYSNIPFNPVTTNTCSVAKIYFFESSIGDSQKIISSKKESRPAFTKFSLFSIVPASVQIPFQLPVIHTRLNLFLV